ncbi:hypothetical protein D3C84_1144890 [compost metagenome]
MRNKLITGAAIPMILRIIHFVSEEIEVRSIIKTMPIPIPIMTTNPAIPDIVPCFSGGT